MRVEPIALQEKRYNYLPQRFMYRGEERLVRRVERSWGEAASWRKPARQFFRVRCQDDQVFNLIHDLQLNVWYLERTET
jgi:hypothetical protein